MSYLNLILALFTMSACAQKFQEKVHEVETKQKIEKVQNVIRPGELRWVQFPVHGEETKLTCRDKEIKFSRDGYKGRAVVIESYFSTLKPFSCELQENAKVTRIFEFHVEDKAYKAEQLSVHPKRVQLSAKDQERANREQLVLNKIYASSLNELQFKRPFIQPLETVVTSLYGTKRVYNKMKKGQHLGTDYRAAIGDKVPASNRGRVVFAGDLFYTGGTVILDHGLDIFTVYGHLSKTKVNSGDMVERGDLIGFSGNTGRTSGPHLHWGVKVQGEYVDGFVLIDETKKNFSE
jgi:murein DD-endopeptidase MepM/ murein hydrolase activator NlpD